MVIETRNRNTEENPDVIYEIYREEREKRLKNGGIEQYARLDQKLPDVAADPWTPTTDERNPVVRAATVVIVGGGLAGLLACYRLHQFGISDICVIDKSGDFGGVWYWNRYPGIRCDTESYVYMPLLEEMGYVPEDKYATGKEIREYAQSIATKISLYDKSLFQTKVVGMEWDENKSRWLVSTDRGDAISAQFVVNAIGQLDVPKVPKLAGLEDYEGKIIHAARWDYQYTGGDQLGGKLSGLKDKKVAIIGTACTAVQAVPHLAESSKHLYVVQRTPSAVDYRYNKKTDKDWAASLKPGWQKERIENFSRVTAGDTSIPDLVADGWTDLTTRLRLAIGSSADVVMDDEQADAADLEKMQEIRGLAEKIVRDKKTAQSLKAYYGFWCKRPTFSDDYLETFNRDNVTLIDTKGRGIDGVGRHGILFDGNKYDVDCIIFASGYSVGTTYTSRTGYDPIGRGGVRLSEKWRDGLRTFRGLHTHGFPNWFLSGLTQVATGPNFMHIISEQMNHAAYVIKTCIERGIDLVDASLEYENDWCRSMEDNAGPRREVLADCTPSYMTNEGAFDSINSHNIVDAIWGGGLPAYTEWTEEFRRKGDLKGLIVNR